MATNTSSNFSADVSNYIAERVLPLAQRQLTAYQFADKLKLPKGWGNTYTATRYSRVNLPFAPLSEGIPSLGETMTISQAQGVAQQWGDSITLTDVAELTIKHDTFKQAMRLMALNLSETYERNSYTGTNGLMAGANVNYASGAASRAALIASDVLSPHEITRAVGTLDSVGAPMFGSPEEENIKVDAGKLKGTVNPHYVVISHPLPLNDLRENSVVSTAWSYSDINRLYTNEIGEWGGARFTKSNMVPYWVGVADPASNTPATTGGALAAGNYIIQITGLPALTSMEQRIYQQSSAITVGGSSAGSISVVLPTLAGYVFNVYISAVGSASVVNLGLCASGPTSGPLAGQATQLASGSTVVITGVGAAQVPPAAPATGVTVYPVFVIGRGAYGVVELESADFVYLKDADKSDKHNQLRIISWKAYYGMMILNQAFFMRVECGSAFSPTYDSGAVAGYTS